MEGSPRGRPTATATGTVVRGNESKPAPILTVPVSRSEIIRFSQLMVHLKASIQTLDCALPPEVGHLPPHQVRVLLYLAHNSGHTVSDLAESLGISLGWASRIIDELEQSGFAERERDQDDRRVIRLRLSARSQTIADRVFRERGSLLEKALSELAPEERESVARFLHRISIEMEKLSGRPG